MSFNQKREKDSKSYQNQLIQHAKKVEIDQSKEKIIPILGFDNRLAVSPRSGYSYGGQSRNVFLGICGNEQPCQIFILVCDLIRLFNKSLFCAVFAQCIIFFYCVF